jgi:RHS repeat-associated protein
MTEAKMLKSTETLASLVYTRDNDGQVKKTTSKSLPGAEITENTYDANNRLTKSGSEYKYDSANNSTTIGTGTYKYDKGSELETGPSLTYTYDELGERTKTKPTTGPATTYGYDQAGNLTSVERPKEGEVSEIKDTYAYNGEGLRDSQTISGTTTNLAWNMTESLPLILSDGTNSYIYGPGGLPVEQVSSGGTITYIHHDQQGSTRLLTGSAGTVTGSTTFDAYGNKTGSAGTSTTPLGYGGQYTSADTGLIYMRARVYDPATVQFLSVDPLGDMTRLPYAYAVDNPLNLNDPSGLIFGIPGTPSWSDLATRFVGFWDGFTRPLAGGTAALRNALGWNGGLDTCSAEYETASEIGRLDLSFEIGAALGGSAKTFLGAVLGRGLLTPTISTLGSGVAGAYAQAFVSGQTPSPSTAAEGAVGGLLGELGTGFFSGRSAEGVSGGISAVYSLLSH